MHKIYSKNAIVIATLFVIGVPMVPLLSNEVMATNHCAVLTGCLRPPPTQLATVNDPTISYETSTNTAYASGELSPQSNPSFPSLTYPGTYDIDASLDITTSNQLYRDIYNPYSDEVITTVTPDGLSYTQESSFSGSTETPLTGYDDFNFQLSLDSTSTEGNAISLNPKAGFETQTEIEEALGSMLLTSSGTLLSQTDVEQDPTLLVDGQPYS